ncbi:hypothetical protein [Actinokineospora iranica]|uniref:Uncharacterized protein n=1 Tax=Actinokineospora iranica TaxID=1271860 RepID=A0A1G6VU72_9PSEU|nr:hypothetical protein [Actinokineospora iranica]SDD56537.1 hypothetical protein SAMN05216174_11372 [Actinokineospora iranica]
MRNHSGIGRLLAQIPNPEPAEPPGAEKIVELIANVKWGAGVALILGFLIGLMVWAGGRWVDHHRAGRVGLIMMLCALAGGMLYAIGWQLISHFSGTK